MTNFEALNEVLSAISAFQRKLQGNAAETESEIEDFLRNKSIEWTLHEELRGIATVLMRAWLEQVPRSAAARALVEEHLAGVGQHDESKRVASGGPPDKLELNQDKLKAFFEAVASSQRD